MRHAIGLGVAAGIGLLAVWLLVSTWAYQGTMTVSPVAVVTSPTVDVARTIAERLPPALATVLVTSENYPTCEWMVVPALVTAYQPDVDCSIDTAGKPTHRTSTSTSTDEHPYGIAADPRLLPYGTTVHVPEYMDVSFPDKAWQVDDTGGAMRASARLLCIVHLDLRYRTVSSALKKGRQWMDINVDVTGWDTGAKDRLRQAAVMGQRMRDQGRLP